MGIDTSGLDNLSSLSFGGLLSPTAENPSPAGGGTGKPLELDIGLVYEDPDNIRTDENDGFSDESIAELAASLKESNGVKQPISVQPADADGRYKINHGARRYRATIKAGLPVIKAFIDESHDDYDQAIENIQREDLEPMEIALFIARREQAGDKTNHIAQRLGKSAGFVSKHKALLNMQGYLTRLYDDGFKNLECLYELQRASKKHAEAVEEFVTAEGAESLTLAKIRAFVAELSAPPQAKADTPSGETAGETGSNEPEKLSTAGDASPGSDDEKPSKEKTPADPDKVKKAIVNIEHDGRAGRILLDRRTAYGLAWIKYDDDGAENQFPLEDVKLIAIMEGA